MCAGIALDTQNGSPALLAIGLPSLKTRIIPMEEYHEAAAVTSSTNPFAYEVVPPIGRLLDIICENRSVGGCFRPGNRWLADRMGYASASQIPYLLSELACLGWITYDPDTRWIMLLRDYRSDRSGEQIDQIDRSVIDPTDQRSGEQIDSVLIDPIDRDIPQQDAEYESDQSDRSIPQCMEDHVLVAAAESDSESAAARYKYHVPQETISRTDHPADLVMAELGTNAKLRAKALAKRPDLTPQQVLATRAHFEPRIAAGLCTAGAFHAALANGEIHAAPPDPQRPLDPESYAADPAYQLGSASDPPDTPESIRDHAARLLPPPTADTHSAHTRDWLFLQGRLGAGDTDEAALAALAAHKKRVGR